MEILFKNIDEVRRCVPWLYASAEFGSFEMDLELATEELMEVVGEKIYNRALEYYQSESTDEKALDHNLVRSFQLPIALFAYKSFADNSDVSHEEDGRKVKIDKDSESLPWEWMLERDNAAMVMKANKAVDRLIAFLDRNMEALPEWRESEQRKDMSVLFVRSAAQFDEVVSIDRSRVFFLRVLPFIRTADRDMVSYIGKERYEAQKAAMKAGTMTDEQLRIDELCREVIPHLVMAKAVRRLAVKVLPDSVVTRFSSERLTLNSELPATAEMISVLEDIYAGDARKGLSVLQGYLKEINPHSESSYKRPDVDYRQEKFFTV